MSLFITGSVLPFHNASLFGFRQAFYNILHVYKSNNHTITFLKISITLFQLERYETCFGSTRTRTNKIIFSIFKLIMAMYGLYTAIGVWYTVEPSVWEGIYCTWDFSNNIMGFSLQEG